MNAQVHIILPPRERLGSRVSGAVGLVVTELLPHSQFRDRTTVWGGTQVESVPGFHYRRVVPGFFRLHSRTESYARRIASAIADSHQTWIEVHNRINVYQVLRQRHAKSRIVLFLHNDPHTIRGAESARERSELLASADAVICVSEFVRQRFLEGISDPDLKTHVIFNALDTASYPPPTSAEPLIVFAGRMVEEKGALILARALKLLLPGYPGWRAEFIGASKLSRDLPVTPYERNVMETLRPLAAQTAYLGALPNAEVQAHFRKARIAVVPSVCLEAFGRVALEAMANGCVVVTSGRGGLIEAVGDVGVLIDPEDPAKIAAAIAALIDDPVRLESLRNQAYQRVKALYDIRIQAARLDALRTQLIAGGNSR